MMYFLEFCTARRKKFHLRIYWLYLRLLEIGVD